MSKANNKKQKVSTNSGVDPSKVLVDLKSVDEDVVITAIRKVQGGISLCKAVLICYVNFKGTINLIN